MHEFRAGGTQRRQFCAIGGAEELCESSAGACRAVDPRLRGGDAVGFTGSTKRVIPAKAGIHEFSRRVENAAVVAS